MEIPYWMSRTQLMMGDESIEKLMNSNVLVVGLGGVGGICAEMIVRAGVGKMTIVDADTVDPSNRNRQIPALKSTEHQLKAEVLAERLLDINPDLKLTVLCEYIKNERTREILREGKFDYVCDCIDTLSPKVHFIRSCMDMKLPIVSSMGAGGKLDPTQLEVCDISETYNCNLAKYVRKYLHKFGIRKVSRPEIGLLIINNKMDRRKLLTQVEKESIIAEYLETDISSRKLAEKHKISNSIILLWAKEYKDNILGQKNKSKKEQSQESLPSDVKQLQKELRMARLENELLNAVIDIAEKELRVDIRKKSGSKQ